MFEKTLELNPDLSDVWVNKGVVLKIIGEQENALQCYIKASKLNNNDESILSSIGVLLGYLHRHKEALDYFYKVIELKWERNRYSNQFESFK